MTFQDFARYRPQRFYSYQNKTCGAIEFDTPFRRKVVRQSTTFVPCTLYGLSPEVIRTVARGIPRGCYTRGVAEDLNGLLIHGTHVSLDGGIVVRVGDVEDRSHSRKVRRESKTQQALRDTRAEARDCENIWNLVSITREYDRNERFTRTRSVTLQTQSCDDENLRS